jgi:hypothetical protein
MQITFGRQRRHLPDLSPSSSVAGLAAIRAAKFSLAIGIRI